MDLINEAYNNNGSEKWINRDLCPRISCLEQVKDMIPNAYITRHDASEEITGVVVAKLCDDDVIYIGPFATRPKFQVLLLPIWKKREIIFHVNEKLNFMGNF